MKISIGAFLQKINQLGECLNAEDIERLLSSLFISYNTTDLTITVDLTFLDDRKKKHSHTLNEITKQQNQSRKDADTYIQYRESFERLKMKDFEYFKELFEQAKFLLGVDTDAYEHLTVEDLKDENIKTIALTFEMMKIAHANKRSKKVS